MAIITEMCRKENDLPEMHHTTEIPANPLEKPGYRLEFRDEFAGLVGSPFGQHRFNPTCTGRARRPPVGRPKAGG